MTTSLCDVLDIVSFVTGGLPPEASCRLACTSRSIRDFVRNERALHKGRPPPRPPGRPAAASPISKTTCSRCECRRRSCVSISPVYSDRRCRQCVGTRTVPWGERLISFAEAKRRLHLNDATLGPLAIRGYHIRACFLCDATAAAFALYGGPEGVRRESASREQRRERTARRREGLWRSATRPFAAAVRLAESTKYGQTLEYYRRWFLSNGRRDILNRTLTWIGRLDILGEKLRDTPFELPEDSHAVRSFLFSDPYEGTAGILEHLASLHWLTTRTDFERRLRRLTERGMGRFQARNAARTAILHDLASSPDPDTVAFVMYFRGLPPYYF